jgi:hypothetical protein
MGAFARQHMGGGKKITWCRVVCGSILGIAAACVNAPRAHAAACSVPVEFAIGAEQHGLLERGSSGVVVTTSSRDVGLVEGDVIRQANGVRVKECADLERAAADALAQGLVLLLAIERGEQRVAVAASARRGAPHEGAVASTTTAPEPAADAPPAEARAERAPPRPVATPVIEPTPVRREVALPTRTGASAALVQRAEAAARALAAVDEAAQSAAPLTLYERRLGEAEAAIGALEFGVDAQESAVRDYVEDALALHRAARDVRRLELETMAQRGLDRRAPLASGLPYFSTSKVPQLVRAYPFLEPCILEAPHEIRMPVPGEAAGRWNPEQALELLWDRTRAASAALAAWARGG